MIFKIYAPPDFRPRLINADSQEDASRLFGAGLSESERALIVVREISPTAAKSGEVPGMKFFNPNEVKPFPAIDETTEMLIEKIKRGEFTPGPPIVFKYVSSHLMLKDGHHRISAICHSGETVQIQIKIENDGSVGHTYRGAGK